MKRLVLCATICFVDLTAAAIEYKDFPPDLQKLLDERVAVLNSSAGVCIAGRVTMSDGARIKSGEDVMVNLYGGVDEPLLVYEGGWFMMDRTFNPGYTGDEWKLVLRAFGYAPNDMPITLVEGKMTYVECAMHKTPAGDLASVSGIVTDAQDKPFDGAIVGLSFPFANHGYRGDIGRTFPHREMTTGSGGKYSFKGLSSAEHSLVASAPDRAYHHVSVTPPAGKAVRQGLKLYRNRKIVVDYVYQPDGSRSFTGGNLQTGTLEWVNGDAGIDFSDGKVEGYERQSLRDLDMRQDQGVLEFQNFYDNGQNGFYDAGDAGFGSVAEAAQTGYTTTEKPCVSGHAYVVKTYENKYAKFVVKSISTNE